MDVLFLSVSAGGGHHKAAEALCSIISEKFPQSRTMVVDTLKYINPIVDKLIVGSYLNTVKNTPQIYRMLYEMSEAGDNMADFSKSFNKLLSYRLKDLIFDFKPSVIVCTHPFSLQMMSVLKRRKKIDIPTVAILTDFVTHSFWIHENIEAYIVAHEYMKYEILQKGIPEHAVYSYGIPIMQNFKEKKDRQELLNNLDLQDMPTMLLMGGSLGFGEIREIFISLLRNKREMQIVVLCGKNAALKRQLEKCASNSSKTVRILGFTNQVADYMEIADFLITKPGGVTVAEALAKELPMLIMSPIPGQEEGNTLFLCNNGAAARILDNHDLESTFCQIIDNPLRIRHMKEISRYLAKPDAAQNIVRVLEKLAQPSSAEEVG